MIFRKLVIFLGNSIDDSQKLEKEKDIATVGILGLVATVIFTSYSILYSTVFINYYLAMMEAFSALISVIALMAYRKYHNYEKVLLAYTFAAFFATLSSSYYSGGITSPHLYWSLVIVLGTELFGTKLIAKAGFVMMLSGFSIFSLISISNVELPASIFTGTFSEIYTIATLFFISITCISFAKLYRNILEKSLREVNNKNNRIEQFVGILSHDIANPLHVINGRADMGMRRDWDVEKNKSVYKIIKDSCIIIQGILKNVRHIEDINNSETRLKLEKINLVELIEELCIDFEAISMKNEIQLVVESQCKKIYIVGDKEVLKKNVLSNILENSFKFSRKNSKIRIQIQNNKTKVSINIIDEGIGIKKNICDGLFDISTKTSTAGVNGEQGIGFGLPLAYGYICELNGEMNITSKHEEEFIQDHGTCVNIKLDIAA